MAHPAFILKTAKNGETYFTLTAGNGEPIGKSEMYKAKSSAENGIESVKKNAPKAEVDGEKNPKFVTKEGKDGQTYFNLTATNGEVILSSEGYKSRSGALNGIESVKKNSQVAEIDDQTDAAKAA